jgi:hypothetical protein
MPRANRYFIPGHVWHITHRCHRSGFLLKFVRDRKRWRYWLFEAQVGLYRVREPRGSYVCDFDAQNSGLSNYRRLILGES